MPSLTLDSDNRAAIAALLADDRWIVACLCAGWCGTCTTYRAAFDLLAEHNPKHSFIWIDIEDQADVVGELDVENFPTLLIQRGETVAFFGTMLPDATLAQRLLQAQTAYSDAELAALADSSEERRTWQRQCNLRTLLRGAGQH